jgi:site-specific DNA-methyltransferase (adenine-specific)
MTTWSGFDELSSQPYFSAENFQLYNSDCIELMNRIPSSSIDIIFADPPYNLSNGGFSVHAGHRVPVHKGDWDQSRGVTGDFQFHFTWLEACRRVLKPEGTMWVSGTYHSIFQCGYALQLLEFKILNDITWYKPNGAPNLSGRVFAASHETLIWARKQQTAKHTFNYEDMKRWEFPEDSLKNPGKQMRSVWSIPTPPPSEKECGKHPTQKPLKLLERVILAATKPGDLILDPFTGSSTTGIAAIKHQRNFIGIDTEPNYLDISICRYQNQTKQQSLL